MGDKIIGVVSLAVMGAILGDMLINYQGTSALFKGITDFATTTYRAAAGAYSG